jgi:stage V sporulation protein AC
MKAFIVGGLICTLGQGIQNFFINFFDFTEKTAGNPTVATLVLLSALLTGLGVYDKIGQFAGAGSAVPVTGFANSLTSAALEHRSEGIVLGIATNMFKLAGNVIVFGVVAAYVVGVIRYIVRSIFM